ncbi:ferredoxin-NADP reductase [Ectopseudomonas oleovorans]|uniref:Ferredoxin-NADP reductase n=1 Tax=Ectopseudomonas oleovorans TaxID=301 RepID=A0A397NAR4_ECTOL|nr:ferredoxin reductase [Pseudomonas oleovorans]RIA34542.1 ferredoxin-NADP reductase [Pseudomonas oleovorans]
MALLPLSLARRLDASLQPLRYLCGNGWLREADVDLVLRFIHPALRLNRVLARVEARRWVAEDMLALTLRCNGNARGWRAGQHVQLYLELDGVRHGRSYSLTAVKPDGRIELAIKRHPGGRMSNTLLDRLEVGKVLELAEAFGELRWPNDARPVLLIAAGSGITPLLGLLRDALARGFSAPVTLLHQVRYRAQRAYAEELQALAERHPNLQLRWALSGEADGRLNEAKLAELPGVHLLGCGPSGFVAQLRQWWLASERGGSLQLESFTPLRAEPVEAGGGVRLGFARSRQQVLGSSALSLLEQAEANGLRPAHGCRQGICASCTCTLLAGTVRDLRSGALFAEPGQPIRLCVSAPHGDVEIDL